MDNGEMFGMLRAMDAYERRNAPEPVTQPESVPEPDKHGYWTRRPDGGLHYHAYDPATEDDDDDAPVAVCALADCDEPAAYACVCCNRRVCFYDIDGAVLDIEPGLCHECLLECAGGMACQVVS